MTSNQIAAKQARETERSNRAREKETFRSNKEKEKLERRGQNVQLAKIGSETALNAAKFITGANDPAWYNLDKQMVKDVANISFSTPLGLETNPCDRVATVADSNAITNTITEGRNSVPGVLVLDYISTIGNKDIITTAGLNIYAYVRHANSGSRNYEYQDMVKYLLAMDSVYTAIAELKRIYSIANTYKGYNKFYSEGYLQGILNDTTFSIKNINLAALRYEINNMVNKVNSLYVPNVMSLFTRHMWMSTNIFKDSAVKRSQNYILTNKFGYKYDEDPESKSFGQLVPFTYKSSDLDLYISNVYSMIKVLQLSEDIGLMSGDILKAYGNGSMFMIDHITEDFHLEEVYSEEVLSQINAATVFPDAVNSSFLIYENPITHEITQGFNTDLLALPNYFNFTGNGLPFFGTPIHSVGPASYPAHDIGIVNMYKDDVSEDDVMVATRLTAIADLRLYSKTSSDPMLVVRLISSGSEVISQGRMVHFTIDPDSKQISATVFGPFYDGIRYSADEKLLSFTSMISCFDWAPTIRIVNISNLKVMYCNKDLTNYAVVESRVIARMHNVAINSELGVPLLGIKVRS